MNTIIENYNSLINKFQAIQTDSTADEIHDKRVILRRIFPILKAFNINPLKVKNGEKAFKLFGKLRDIQVQIERLESTEQTPQLIEYHEFLKRKEIKLKTKVQKFSKRKEIKFPTIKENSKVDNDKIKAKATKQLNKLIEKTQLQSIDDASDTHKIRIEFKKYRYIVEILAYIENIDQAKIERMKRYQDVLGEIQDYEVLINGIKKFYKKRELGEEVDVDLFEKDQNTQIEKFESEIQQFIDVCRAAIVNVTALESDPITKKI
jgi:CHAD domain-containing protein